MATRDPKSSTTEEFLPFLPGDYDVEDSGSMVNVISYKHSYNGRADQVYYTPRPGIQEFDFPFPYGFEGQYVSAGGLRIATTEDLYTVHNDSCIPSSTVKALWAAAFPVAGAHKSPVVAHGYSDVEKFFNVVIDSLATAPTVKSYMFIEEDEETTAVALPFAANPYAASLDGYLFVAGANSDTIYNSDLNDLTTWDTDVNLIRASQYSGEIKALSRISSYIVALKDRSIEFFYNAGLSDTSPLERNASYTKQIGLRYASSLVSSDNHLYFIGTDSASGMKVYDLTETSCTPISVPKVEESVASLDSLPYNTRRINAYFMSYRGKRFYVLQLDSTEADTEAPGVTYVYDIDDKRWTVWRTTINSVTPQTKFNFQVRYCFEGVTSGYGLRAVIGRNLGAVSGVSVPDMVRVGAIPTSQGAGLPVFTDYLYDNTGDGLQTTEYSWGITLTVPPTDFGTYSRKFLRQLSMAGYVKDNGLLHQLTVIKYGTEDAGLTKTSGSFANLRMWNLGQCKVMKVTYKISRPPDYSGTNEAKAEDVRIFGVHCLVSKGY